MKHLNCFFSPFNHCNPIFFKHFLKDIALNHETKLQTRIQPIVDDFKKITGKNPEKLMEVLLADLVCA